MTAPKRAKTSVTGVRTARTAQAPARKAAAAPEVSDEKDSAQAGAEAETDTEPDTPASTSGTRGQRDTPQPERQAPAESVESETTAPSVEVSAPTPVSAASPAASLAVAPLAAQAAVTQSLPHTLVTMARKAVDALLAPFARPIQSGPVTSPILLMVEWFRRTTVGTFYNRTPSASPVQIGENADGVVIGTLGATDPDGDPLTYTVTQAPTRGTVVINPNGTYVYTPNAALAADGGSDTFTVSISDNGFRLLSQPGRTTVDVGVEVGAGASLAINGTPFAIAMSPDGRRAYVTDPANNRISIVDIDTRAVTGSIATGGNPLGIAIASDGRGYVVNSADGTVTVFDTVTNRIVRPYVYVGASPTGISVNASGTRVVVANSYEDSVSVIDTGTWDVTRVVVGDGPYGVAITGNRALITNELADTVSVIDLSTNTVVGTIDVGDAPTGITAAGNRAVVTNTGTLTTPGDGSITIIDLDTLTVIGTPIAVGDSPVSVVIDGTATLAYIADADRSTVSTLNLTTGDILDTRTTAIGPTGMAIGTDGALYITGYTHGSIDVIDVDATPAAAMVAARTLAATAAAPTPAQQWYTSTSGLDIYNDSMADLVIGYFGVNRPNGGGPAAGTILAPGAHLHLEIPAIFGGFVVEMTLTNPAGEVSLIQAEGANLLGLILPNVRVVQFDVQGDVAARQVTVSRPFLGDPSIHVVGAAQPTIRTVDAADPEAAALLSACARSKAECTWRETGQPTQGWGQWQQALNRWGTPVREPNRSDEDYTTSFDVAATSIAKMKDAATNGDIAGVMFWQNRSIQNYLWHPESERLAAHHYETTTPPLVVAAMFTTTVEMRLPVLRYAANTAVTIGNSTVIITGLTYEIPDLDRQLDFRPVVGPLPPRWW